MNHGTHMSDGERRKPIDIEVCRSRSQLLKLEQKFDILFVSTQYLRFTLLMTCRCNGNPAQYERNRRFRHLVYVLG